MAKSTIEALLYLLLSWLLTGSYAQRTITLSAGLIVEPGVDGFQVDMLEEIKKYAASENISLEVEMEELTIRYNGAFDLIADDCEELDRVKNKELCRRYDIMIGSYFANRPRSLRADLSPAWLQGAISANRYEGTRPNYKFQPDYYTFDEADKHGGTICVYEGTYFSRVVQERYKGANYYFCQSYDDCIQSLTDAKCAMYAGLDILLKHQSTKNPALVQTRDAINKNFLVWPMSHRTMAEEARELMKGWIYQAVSTADLDKLYDSHYKIKTCPLGFAGKSCDLPCDPVHGSADRAGNCICDSTKWEGDDCSIEVFEDTNMIPEWQLVVGYLMVAINVAAVVFFALWLRKNRNLPRINVAQPFFLALILLGCLFSTFTILALMQQAEPDDNEDDVHCMVAPWLYSVGFCITFGTLFAKIRRVHQIFRSSTEMRRVTVTIYSTLQDIALVLSVDVVILICWSVLSPLQWERTITVTDKYGVPLESVGYCSSDHWEVFVGLIGSFHFLLLCVACVMCYVTRNIPEKFSGGSFAAMAMVSNLQILSIGVPVAFLVGNNANAHFFLQSAIIWINDLVVILITFGSLMVAKHYDFERASMRTLVKESMGEFIQNEKQEKSARELSSKHFKKDSKKKKNVKQWASDATRWANDATCDTSSKNVSSFPRFSDVPNLDGKDSNTQAHDHLAEQEVCVQASPDNNQNSENPAAPSLSDGKNEIISLTEEIEVSRSDPSIEGLATFCEQSTEAAELEQITDRTGNLTNNVTEKLASHDPCAEHGLSIQKIAGPDQAKQHNCSLNRSPTSECMPDLTVNMNGKLVQHNQSAEHRLNEQELAIPESANEDNWEDHDNPNHSSDCTPDHATDTNANLLQPDPSDEHRRHEQAPAIPQHGEKNDCVTRYTPTSTSTPNSAAICRFFDEDPSAADHDNELSEHNVPSHKEENDFMLQPHPPIDLPADDAAWA